MRPSPPVAVADPEPDVSPEAALGFGASVQPFLANQCVECHAKPDFAGKFKLIRVVPGEAGPHATRTNLRAVAGQLRKDNPAASPLLLKTLSAHGGMKLPAVESRQAAAYLGLEGWVALAIGTPIVAPPVAPVAPAPVMPVSPVVPVPVPVVADPLLPPTPPVSPLTPPVADPLPSPVPVLPAPTPALPNPCPSAGGRSAVPATGASSCRCRPRRPNRSRLRFRRPTTSAPVVPPVLCRCRFLAVGAADSARATAAPKPPSGVVPTGGSQFGSAIPPKPPITGPSGDEFDPASFNQLPPRK